MTVQSSTIFIMNFGFEESYYGASPPPDIMREECQPGGEENDVKSTFYGIFLFDYSTLSLIL